MTRSKTRWARFGLPLAANVLLTGCGGSGGPTQPPAPTPVASKAFVYLLHGDGLENAVAGFQVVPADGSLKTTVTVSDAKMMSADPDGRWLYVSGADGSTLRTYAISPEDGSLTLASSLDTSKWPWRIPGMLLATRGILFGGTAWTGGTGWTAYGVDHQSGRLTPPSSEDFGKYGRECQLAVGPMSDFAYASCEPYPCCQDQAIRSWSVEANGTWREIGRVTLPGYLSRQVVCGERLLVLDEINEPQLDVGISVFALESATGRLTYLARTVLDLNVGESMACGSEGYVATLSPSAPDLPLRPDALSRVRLFRVGQSGAVASMGALEIPGYRGQSLAFHPSGQFVYVWGDSYVGGSRPQQASLVTLAVGGGGELSAFSQTPVDGTGFFRSQVVVTRPAP